MPAFQALPPHAPAVPSAHRVRASSVTAMHAPDRCWWLYLLECGDGTWYAGISNDLPSACRRMPTARVRANPRARSAAAAGQPRVSDRASAARGVRLKQLPRRRKLAFFAAGDEG